MIFVFLVLALLYPILKQMAPDPQAQSLLLTVLAAAVIALSLISIAPEDASSVIVHLPKPLHSSES